MNAELANEIIELMSRTNASLEATMTDEEREAVAKVLERPAELNENVSYASSEEGVAVEDFESASAVEATEAMLRRVQAFLEVRGKRLYKTALDAYYVIEEMLAKDPDNAELQKHAAKMREMHLSQYGFEIPKRGE